MSYSTINTITLFFAMLSILAIAIVVLVLASALTGDRFGIIGALRSVAVELAAAVAVTSMAGSLIMSEVLGFAPCLNCWIQRAFMYPAALLLTAAVFTKRMVLVKAAAILALLGLPVAVFHRYEQAIGTEIGGLCDAAVPCSAKYFEHFGFVTIPTMASIGFVTVIALSLVALRAPAVSAEEVLLADPNTDSALV